MGDTLRVNGIVADFSNETLKDASGNSIVLRPQCFAVLRVLAERSNQLVTKDELIQAVWPGTAVTDDSLVQCIHEIRHALNDEQRNTLKTVPKRGYRLVIPDKAAAHGSQAAITALAKAASAAPARRPVLAAAALILVAAGALLLWLIDRPARGPTDAGTPLAIAVLPFETLSGEPGRTLADGMTEDLITELAKLSGILVVARNAAHEFRDRSVAIEQIARQLGLRYVLVGSVQRDGDRVRINAHLIDGIAGHHLWAERYDGSLADVFGFQDTVARNIASALATEVTAAQQPEKGYPQSTNVDSRDLNPASPNKAATAVIFENAVTTIAANTSTAHHVRVADLRAVDDGFGTNVFSLSGQDAAFFEIAGESLYLKAGVALNVAAKASYNLAVAVDDSSVGGSPDATNSFTLTLTEAGEPPSATNLN